ncbi:MAG: hypothetical protein LZF86_190344 [Nitrospira sp.]|nr:MAG: hypothetical protein LZF86_190344 [Nitrospira sp.]
MCAGVPRWCAESLLGTVHNYFAVVSYTGEGQGWKNERETIGGRLIEREVVRSYSDAGSG